MILPAHEECARVLKALDQDPALTEWQQGFIDSNLGRSTFTDRQREIVAEMKEKFDV